MFTKTEETSAKPRWLPMTPENIGKLFADHSTYATLTLLKMKEGGLLNPKFIGQHASFFEEYEKPTMKSTAELM